MKQLTLIRLSYEKEQTLGYLFDGLKKLACTLELEWADNQKRISCIPEGCYKVVKRTSEKYKEHFHILDVVGRDWILIHHGNFHKDILGCILVGYRHTDIDGDGYRDVTSSRSKMNELVDYLPNEFELVIK